MRKRLKNIGALLLLVLFAGYWSCVTLFPHVHRIDGLLYVHSHPLFGSGRQPDAQPLRAAVPAHRPPLAAGHGPRDARSPGPPPRRAHLPLRTAPPRTPLLRTDAELPAPGPSLPLNRLRPRRRRGASRPRCLHTPCIPRTTCPAHVPCIRVHLSGASYPCALPVCAPHRRGACNPPFTTQRNNPT